MIVAGTSPPDMVCSHRRLAAEVNSWRSGFEFAREEPLDSITCDIISDLVRRMRHRAGRNRIQRAANLAIAPASGSGSRQSLRHQNSANPAPICAAPARSEAPQSPRLRCAESRPYCRSATALSPRGQDGHRHLASARATLRAASVLDFRLEPRRERSSILRKPLSIH